jgi:hypothetical protein
MKIRLSALLAIALIVGLSACKKTNNDAPAVITQVRLNVVNASVDTFNFYLNGSRKNTTSTILPGSITGYYYVPAGQQSYQLKKPFNIATNTIQTLFSITLPADSNVYRSLFVTDATEANAFAIDDIPNSTTKTDTCFIRFVNASPGSGPLDMALGSTTQFTNVAFKSVTGSVYASITLDADTTSGLIPIKVFAHGSTTPLATDSVSLQQGASYTFFLQGKAGTPGYSINYVLNFVSN